MKFRASFCDPFNPTIIELGEIPRDKIFEKFDSFPWLDLIKKMSTAKQNEIHYSPSFEVDNLDNKNGLSVSAIDGKEWYIFYKRPKKVKVLGLFEKLNQNYLTDIKGQTEEEVRNCISALLDNNLDYLDNKIK